MQNPRKTQTADEVRRSSVATMPDDSTQSSPSFLLSSSQEARPSRSLVELQKSLGYQFHKKNLLQLALRHRSAPERKRKAKSPEASLFEAESSGDKGLFRKATKHNERLEFLGDAVLNLVIGEYLMEHAESFNEGMLSKIRASLVNEKTLAMLAKQIHLPDHLYLGKAEERSGGRNKSSIVADGLEAIFAAIYLDGGLLHAKEVIIRIYAALLAENLANRVHFDYKTHLQERTQELFKCTPKYQVIKSMGPDHNKVFSVLIQIPGMADEILGTGSSIKEASQDAARLACERLDKQIANIQVLMTANEEANPGKGKARSSDKRQTVLASATQDRMETAND